MSDLFPSRSLHIRLVSGTKSTGFSNLYDNKSDSDYGTDKGILAIIMNIMIIVIITLIIITIMMIIIIIVTIIMIMINNCNVCS